MLDTQFNFKLLMLIGAIKFSITQANLACSTLDLKGVCVTLETCDSINKATKAILTPDALQTVRNRIEACKHHQKDFVCCDQADVNSNLLLKPPLTSITFATADSGFSPTTPLLTVDLENHPKYNMFKDLKCGSNNGNRVANGENADFYEFPWAARLGYENKLEVIEYSCGGSLISDFYVLTAAHCLVGLKSRLKLDHVRLGEYDASKEIDCDPDELDRCADPVQDIKIKSVVSHPEYSSKTYTDDIGLVELSEAAKTMQKNIEPICLPITEELQELQKLLVVIGWGRTDSSTYPEILQKAVVPLFNYTICHQQVMKKFKITLNDRQFCAGGEGKIDSCKGDSGSPIMGAGFIKGKPKFIQSGLVSYGILKCGEEDFPGIYTEVSKFLPWILDNVQ